jgi:uncharacterized lipoprotein YbaY
VALVALAGCAGLRPAPSGRLVGSLSYREQMELPPGATVTVTLLALEEASLRVLDRQSVDAPHGGRIPFELSYDPDWIDGRTRFAVEALIAVGDRPWFATPDPPPEVALERTETQVHLVLERIR